MQFGMFYEWPNPSLGNWKRLFDEGVAQIQYAEEMGYDYVLIAEHHFSNYGMSPAPLLQALQIAQHTRRIKIVTAALILPIWQPLRLAEEVAVLDNLTDGRFICGVGRGYQAHEFGRFGVGSADSRVRFTECLDVLLKAWTSEESFTYDGEYIKVPEPVVVWPKPLQKPHPPLWLVGSSADSARLAAERGATLLTSGSTGPAAIRNAAATWVHTRQAAGASIHGLEMALQTVTHVAETDTAAEANTRYARWQNRANRALQRREVVNGAVDARPYDGELNDADFYNGLYYGSPDTVIAKYRRLAEAGGTILSNWMMVGGMEHEKLMQSIRLMGEEVIPALRDVRPPPDLPEQLLASPLMMPPASAGGASPPGRAPTSVGVLPAERGPAE